MIIAEAREVRSFENFLQLQLQSEVDGAELKKLFPIIINLISDSIEDILLVIQSKIFSEQHEGLGKLGGEGHTWGYGYGSKEDMVVSDRLIEPVGRGQ